MKKGWNTHRSLRRIRGQSVPLLALMIVVLTGMVALSVDVGRTFAEERRAVAAANAASLAAMNTYIRRPAGTTNTVIYDSIVNSLRSNGIDVNNNPNIRLEAYYLNARGEPIEGGARITRDGTVAPDNVAYIQVNLSGNVDTFFARVVNQNQLPIAATAYAGTCPPTDGVYPIGINNDYISGNEFRNPGDADGDGQPDNNWTRLTSGNFRGYTKMRLYLADNNQPGQFGWLRWLDGRGASGANANSAQELEMSLSGTGTLSKGFMEAPWPNINLPRPANYPERPGELNVGDWVYGSSGFTASNDRRAALDAHISNQTLMVLPIYDVAAGQGSNAVYRVVRFGLFVLTEYGRERNRPYMDFIFLGTPNRQGTACSATPPPPEDTSVVRLTGSVEFWPEYMAQNSMRRPVRYVVVLDVSGSMNANFAGYGIRDSHSTGWNGSRITINRVNRNASTRCDVDAYDPQVDDCNGHPSNAWFPLGERRIYVAKKSLELFVSLANMPGNPNYDQSIPDDQMALVWFHENVKSTYVQGFTNDVNRLRQSILDANSDYAPLNQPYLPAGGTNGTGGLYRAYQLLKDAPKEVFHNGRSWQYRPVILFITDGITNIFFNDQDGSLNGGRSVGTFAPDHFCASLGNRVIDHAECQTTEFGGPVYRDGRLVQPPIDRPLTQQIKMAQRIKSDQSIQPEIYVLAISDIPATGLKGGVATTPNHYYQAATLERDANGLSNVDRIMMAINDRVEKGPCISGNDGEWRGTIPGNHFQSVNGLSYPNVGEVILEDVSTRSVYRAPIVAGTDGRVRYTFESIPRGTYRLQAYLFYRHPLDPPTALPRMYSQLFNGSSIQSDMVVVLEPSGQGVGFISTIEQNLHLRLDGNVCSVN